MTMNPRVRRCVVVCWVSFIALTLVGLSSPAAVRAQNTQEPPSPFLAPGKRDLSISWTYSRAPSVVFISGFEGPPIRIETPITSLALGAAMRFGVSGGGELQISTGARAVWGEFILNGTTLSSGFSAGLSDVNASFSRLLLRESRTRPGLMGSIGLGWLSTVEPLAQGSEARLLNGRAGVVVFKRVDPVAYFGGLSFQHFGGARTPLGSLVLGSTLELTLGMNFAITPEIVFGADVSYGLVGPTTLEGTVVDPSSHRARVNLSTTYLLDRSRSYTVAVSIGALRQTPDFSISISHSFPF